MTNIDTLTDVEGFKNLRDRMDTLREEAIDTLCVTRDEDEKTYLQGMIKAYLFFEELDEELFIDEHEERLTD